MNQYEPMNAFTVDVEDYFHVTAFAGRIGRSTWSEYPSRVVANTHRLLRLLRRNDVHATFFVLGWVARRCPQLLRDIRDEGHEIGYHSYWHRPVYELTIEEFRQDLILGRRVVEDIIGQAVDVYRAPAFSITKQCVWAFQILATEGFRLDSSVHSKFTYGVSAMPTGPCRMTTESGRIDEFPVPAYNCWGFRLPIAGGGYFRLYPAQFSIQLLKWMCARQRQPLVFYIHPWEVDPEQPRLAGPWSARCRHYLNLRTVTAKLEELLSTLQFTTLSSAWKSVERVSQLTVSDISITQARRDRSSLSTPLYKRSIRATA